MAHHEFIPEVYHVTIGSHDPVLEVAPGDSISTTTVDARGRDEEGRDVPWRGNPQTGPFSLTGAEPGDTLVVTFDELRPSRDWGFTATSIAANVLEPGFVAQFDADDEQVDGDDEQAIWDVDVEAWTTRMRSPKGPLCNIDLPLDPMVGCFGVAPPRGQAISTATSSTHGGNMDYRGFRQGVKVYLPVAVEGGLFHIGDGHAVQGDGEIVGTGIEISFDVRFTLDLINGKQISWPRAENDEYIMAVGNARPLDQAVQHASTEMLSYLEQDYGLDARTAHLMMGQCVEYDIGNIYDPAYTMVCKIRKDILQKLSG